MGWLRGSFWLLFTALMLSYGCRKGENRAELSQKTEGKPHSSIKVNLLDEKQLANLIEQRLDRILLINVWATWCIPCRKEFPDLVRLAEKYKDRELDIIAISADYPDEIESKIIPFIQSQQVNFPVYVQNFATQEDFINFINRDWSGALPASFLYNADGEQTLFLLGKQSYQEFVSALENEL